MVLWYKQPGLQWLEGLPIGNGYMGAMVFGRVNNERIALNESTFWSGRPNDYTNPEAYKYFDAIRDLVFAGKYKEAENLINEHFYGILKTSRHFITGR
jgi:alpha-L-fucosidase 2